MAFSAPRPPPPPPHTRWVAVNNFDGLIVSTFDNTDQRNREHLAPYCKFFEVPVESSPVIGSPYETGEAA